MAGIVPTRARSIVLAHRHMCRKLLYEVVLSLPQLKKNVSYLYVLTL